MPMTDRSHRKAETLAEEVELERVVWWHLLSAEERTAFEVVRDAFMSIAAGRRDDLNCV